MQTVTVITTCATTVRYYRGEDLIDQTGEASLVAGDVAFHGAGALVTDRLVVVPVMGDYYMVLNREDVALS